MTRRSWWIAPILLAIGFGLGVSLLHSRNDVGGPRLAMARGGLGGLFGNEYRFTDLRILSSVLVKVRDQYLDPRRAVPDEMLEAALQRVEHVVPEALFVEDESGERLRIVVGNKERTVPLGALESIGDLGGTLRVIARELDELLDPSVDRQDVEYALTNGMLSTLDPHSVLIVPDEFEDMQADNVGSFGGLGISIQIIDRRLTVTCPIPDTPAADAGMKSGDVISRIGSVSTTNMPIDQAVNRLRGNIGEPVNITILREGEDVFERTVVRESISLPHLEQLYLGDGVGYVRLRKFYRTAYSDLQAAIDDLDQKTSSGLQGLVLDLRNNPGGLLTQAEEIADLFLEDGDIVSVVGAEGTRMEVTKAKAFGTRDSLRVAVLVNSDTASASEIVAGALRAHDRAVVLGTRTFGKGSVQNLWPLPDGSALKLTTAEYLSSGQVSLQSQGILPDVELLPSWVDGEDVALHYQDAAFREEDLDTALASRYAEDGKPPELVVHYVEPKLSRDAPPRDRFDCRGVAEMSEDFQVQIARTLLVNSRSAAGGAMLDEADGALTTFLAGRERELREQIEARGLSWNDAQLDFDGSHLDLSLNATLTNGQDALVAGDEAVMRFELQNESGRDLPRVRAMIDSEVRALSGRELVFGDLKHDSAGQAEFKVTIPPDIYTLVEEAKLTVFSGDVGPVAELPLRVKVREQALPHFSISVSLVDDGSGNSEGNGDGLLSAGESVDLAVTVKNVGSAPTGDRWLADWWHRSNDDRPENQRTSPEGACYVTVWETSGESLYFPDGEGGGSCSGWAEDMAFKKPLEPGESRHMRFNFQVPGELLVETPMGTHVPATPDDPIRLHVMVRDQALWESADEELRLTPPTGLAEVKKVDKQMQTRGQVEALAAASGDAKVLARLDGPVQVRARVGDYWRVDLPWGVPGFVAADSLKSGRGREEIEVQEVLAQRPPLIGIDNMPELVTSAESLSLSGRVSDEEAIEHLLVFLNGRKVKVLTPTRAGSSNQRGFPFELSLKLEEGVNEVELVATDASDGLSSRHLAIFREKAQRAAEGPASTSPEASEN